MSAEMPTRVRSEGSRGRELVFVCSLGLAVNEGHFIHFGPDTLQIVQGKENSVSLGGRQPQKFSGAYRSKLLII